jgi:hypothetical protein
MVLNSLRPGKPPIRTHTRMFSPRWLTMRAACTVAGRRLQQLFPGLFSWLFTWPAERLLGRVSGGACVCVCVASPLNGTLDAWKITREMSLTFIVAVRRHSACIYGGVSRHYIILHACECVFDIALLKVGLTAGTRGAATYFSWSRRRARIHNNERGVRYHSRLFYAEEIGVSVGKAAHRFCGVSAGLECGLGWKIVFPPLG